MIAFWKYDQYPYCLHGTVQGYKPVTGAVAIKGYPGGSFTPIIILPDDKGKEVADELDKLRASYEVELKKLKELYMREAKRVAPFLEGVI